LLGLFISPIIIGEIKLANAEAGVVKENGCII
jgi:hypothetical protein